MSAPHTDVDPDALRQFSFQLFSKLEGAMTAGMVHLGDRLGLYRAMRSAGAPLSPGELAARLGLHERWVREWAYNQAAAGLIEIDDDERISLTPQAAVVLADPSDPAFAMGWFHDLPVTIGALDAMPESFRTGLGYDYDSHGRETAVGMERSFEPWNTAHLVADVLPELDGVVDKLRRGASAADLGCGAGSAVLLMAREFPASWFTGYDISEFALERAREKRSAAGLNNASFHDVRETPMPADHSLDLVTTFDCIHDMTHPAEAMRAIRFALADDGTWLLVDIKARDTFAENAAKNPMASMMYGISVLTCLSSAMSEHDGAGLGTLGLPEGKAREMAFDAGFTRFRKLPVDHPVNAFYEIRP